MGVRMIYLETRQQISTKWYLVSVRLVPISIFHEAHIEFYPFSQRKTFST